MENKTSELRNKLTELKSLSKMNLESIPAASRPGWESRARNAASQIEDTENSLVQEILSKSITIVIESGVSQAKDVIDTLSSSEEEGTVIGLDYMFLEKTLVERLFSQVKNGTYPFNGPAISQLNVLLSDVGSELGVLEMPIVENVGNLYGTLTNKDEAILRVRQMIEKVMDNDFKNLVLKKRLTVLAKSRLNLDRLAVVLYNVPREYLNSSNVLNVKTAVVALDSSAGDVVVATGGMTGKDLVKDIVSKISGKKKKQVATQTEQ